MSLEPGQTGSKKYCPAHRWASRDGRWAERDTTTIIITTERNTVNQYDKIYGVFETLTNK